MFRQKKVMDVLGEWIKQPASVEERSRASPFPPPPVILRGDVGPSRPSSENPWPCFFLPGPWTPAEVSSKEIGMDYNITSLFPSSCHSETPTVLMS